MNIAAAGFGPRSSENAVPNAGKGRLFNFAKEAIEDELDILLQKQKEAEALADKVLPLIKAWSGGVVTAKWMAKKTEKGIKFELLDSDMTMFNRRK